jgi:DNA-cytosine methyltransferase
MMSTTELQFGDLFAGAGGLSLGFILANHPELKFRSLFAIDNDKEALQSYKNSMSWLAKASPSTLPSIPKTYVRDIEKLNSKALLRLFSLKKGDLDLLIGGPPCQGYSTANRQSSASSKSDRNRLSKFFFDKIEDIQPKMFLLENVQGVKWTEPTQEMEIADPQMSLLPEIIKPVTNVQNFMIDRAKALGYRVWHSVLNAVDFGVPQTRYRFFLFGIRSDICEQVEDISLTESLETLKETNRVTVGDAIGDLPEIENGQNWVGEHYQPNKHKFVQLMRCFMQNGELQDHFATKHADYVIERYQNIPEGGNWKSIRNLMLNYSKIDNTHSNIYRRLKNDSPAITISHYRKSMIIHPTQDRGLSFREACRLQSFPDWYCFNGVLSRRQQQIANAVPPLLASKIAHAIANYWLIIHKN